MISLVTDRVAGLKATGEGRWMARCPAHEDRSPSLSIRETGHGQVLLHCFAGCDTEDILTAVGLCFSDLYDKPLAHHLPPIRGGFNARELLELTAHESAVADIIITEALDGPLSEEARTRLALAATRIAKARDLASG